MENKSIWNWELYQKYFGEKNLITNKIKSKDELISRIINKLSGNTFN